MIDFSDFWSESMSDRMVLDWDASDIDLRMWVHVMIVYVFVWGIVIGLWAAGAF